MSKSGQARECEDDACRQAVLTQAMGLHQQYERPLLAMTLSLCKCGPSSPMSATPRCASPCSEKFVSNCGAWAVLWLPQDGMSGWTGTLSLYLQEAMLVQGICSWLIVVDMPVCILLSGCFKPRSKQVCLPRQGSQMQILHVQYSCFYLKIFLLPIPPV